MSDDSENLRKSMEEAFSTHYRIADEVRDSFSQMLWKNPDEALNNLFKCYNESLNKAYTDPETGENYRVLVEAFAGGPHEAIPSAFYNAIGTIYPHLNREIKNKALERILGNFGGIRYDYVQNSHTSYIREPLLLSDIVIAQSLYWPGLDEGKNLIKKYKNLFCDFKFEAIDEKGNFNPSIIDSDFIVAYSILRKDFCNWGDDYTKIANPKFLDRVVNGISGMRFASYFKLKSLSKEEIDGINDNAKDPEFYSKNKTTLNKVLDKKISEGRDRLRELLPKSLHKKIDENMARKDWAEPLFSQHHKNYALKYWIENYTK